MYVFNNQCRIVAIFSLLLATTCYTSFSQKLKPIAQLVQNAKAKKRFTQFRPFQQLSERSIVTEKKFSNFIKEETLLTVSTEGVKQLYKNTTGALTMTIPYKNELIEVEVVEQKNLWDNFKVTTSSGQTLSNSFSTGKFYRGIIKGDNESIVSLSIFNNEISGQIASPTRGNIVLNKTPDKESQNTYIIYAENDLLIKNDFTCATDEHEIKPVKYNSLTTRGLDTELSNKWVRIYFETDYDLFLRKDSSVEKTVNYVTGIFNNVATLFMNENINVAISEIFVWNKPSPYSRTNTLTALTEFTNARKGVKADLAQLLTYGGRAGGGVAYVNSLCSDYRFSYANIRDTYEEFPTYSWTVFCMTHEIGHNLGSMHTQFCYWPGGAIDNCARTEGGCPPGPEPINGGTIMSYCYTKPYGVNFANGFGPLPGEAIRNSVANAPCLGTSLTCLSPQNIIFDTITCSTSKVHWSPVEGVNGYNINYKSLYDFYWKSETSNEPSVIIKNLNPLDTIIVNISSVCDEGTSPASQTFGFSTINNTRCEVSQPAVATNITNTSALVTWQPVECATYYSIDIKDESGIWYKDYVSNSEKTFTGLLTSKQYDIRVSAYCANVEGPISQISTFTTLATTGIKAKNMMSQGCATPTSPTVTAITPNSANISWAQANKASTFKLEYKKSSDVNWTSYNTEMTSMVIENLNDASAYDIRLSEVCTDIISEPTLKTTFTTLALNPCDMAIAPKATSLDGKNVTVTWVGPDSASLYILEYRSMYTSNWSAMKVSGNSAVLKNLTQGLTYYFRVTAACGKVKGNASPISYYTFDISGAIDPDKLNNVYTISPNPTSGAIKLQIDSEKEMDIEVSLMDATGKTVKMQPKMPIIAGTQFYDIDMTDLNNGFYFVRINDADKVVVKKVLLVRQ